jgi:hypothetical protein
MSNESIEQTQQWIGEYYRGYQQYMLKHYPELFNKFYQNIHPPQRIGGGVMIGKSARNTDDDYAEIMKISREFSDLYPNPINFPKEF